MNAPSPTMRLRWAADDDARLRLAGEFAAELSRLQGYGLEPQPGCHLLESTLFEASCWIEFEVTPEEGDGWNEPHYPEEVAILGCLINGTMCSVDEMPDSVIDRWTQEAHDHLQSLRDDDMADRADAMARDREFA